MPQLQPMMARATPSRVPKAKQAVRPTRVSFTRVAPAMATAQPTIANVKARALNAVRK